MRVLVAIIALVVWSAAAAQDFNSGLDAYDRGDFAAAMAQWQPLAEQGDVRAQFNLGVIHFNGQGVPFDPATAAHWYRAAADQGYGPAQANLALLYDTGQGVLQNFVEALKWAMLAQRHGVTEAEQVREALVAKMTPEQIAEAERAAAAWQRASTATTTLATGRASDVTSLGSQTAQAAETAPIAVTQQQIIDAQRRLNALGFDAGAADGIAGPRTIAALRAYQEEYGLEVTGAVTAEVLVHLASVSGDGRPADAAAPPADGGRQPVSAAQREPPAAAGPARSMRPEDCDLLAGHPDDPALPEGVAGVAFADIDGARALAACELALAADRNNARYQFQLGRSAHKADRMAEAVSYYLEAGLQGHMLAQKTLGFAYTNGLGVSQDYAKAAQWHHIAAEQGDSDAQRNLGYLYAGGLGVAQDYVQAYMWYSIAAERGSAGAAETRKLLAGRMTNRQIAEAERRAAEWFKLHPEMRPAQ